VQCEASAVADGDARRLLTAVLEGMQADEGGAGDRPVRPPHADDAALLARAAMGVRGPVDG
jgi:hypothetical protein